MTGRETRVTAVVVTFNRAEKLKKVLEHLRSQTLMPESVIVINNASTDHTAEVLERVAKDDERFLVHHMSENLGGAGGFAEGMARAHGAGTDVVWIMDDDCYAAPDALEKLVDGYHRAESRLGERVSFAGSMAAWSDGSLCVMNSFSTSSSWGELIVRGEPITMVENGSFVSLLIPQWAIARFGLPLREYFIWSDDVEYTHRLRQGGRGIQVHDSVVVHDLVKNEGANVAEVDAASLWKFRYGMRNQSSFLWHHSDRYRWLQFVLMTAVRMRRGRVKWRYRLQLYRSIIVGLRFDPKPQMVSGE